jgi:hypothetical protein
MAQGMNRDHDHLTRNNEVIAVTTREKAFVIFGRMQTEAGASPVGTNDGTTTRAATNQGIEVTVRCGSTKLSEIRLVSRRCTSSQCQEVLP